MPDLLVRSFAPLLLAFQSCFTQPSFHSFWALTCARIPCSGRRSLTRIIQSAQLTEFKHYCSFHRFFSQARWKLDDLGHRVFQLLLPFCAEVLVGAVDDTLARKSGRHIWGAGIHHHPLRSTQSRPFFASGHNWVVFSLHVSFAFAPQKTWALPILVRLYRKRKNSKLAPGRGGKLERKQIGQATDQQYRTRPQLAVEMIQLVAGWAGQRKKSQRLPNPEQMAQDRRRDVKQFLGFEDPQNRVPQATQRTAPLIFYIYDLAILWYAQSGHRLARQSTLQRLWYQRKTTVSFEDILRTLRQATWHEKIFSAPRLDAHTRKILQPLMEWAKAAA